MQRCSVKVLTSRFSRERHRLPNLNKHTKSNDFYGLLQTHKTRSSVASAMLAPVRHHRCFTAQTAWVHHTVSPNPPRPSQLPPAGPTFGAVPNAYRPQAKVGDAATYCSRLLIIFNKPLFISGPGLPTVAFPTFAELSRAIFKRLSPQSKGGGATH